MIFSSRKSAIDCGNKGRVFLVREVLPQKRRKYAKKKS